MIDMVKPDEKARSALYRNNGDGTFTDVTDRAGVGHIGWGMGAAVGDYDNDGWDELFVPCLGQHHLQRNHGAGTLAYLSDNAGARDPRVQRGGASAGVH